MNFTPSLTQKHLTVMGFTGVYECLFFELVKYSSFPVQIYGSRRRRQCLCVWFGAFFQTISDKNWLWTEVLLKTPSCARQNVVYLLKTVGYCPDTKFSLFEAQQGGGWCEDGFGGKGVAGSLQTSLLYPRSSVAQATKQVLQLRHNF